MTPELVQQTLRQRIVDFGERPAYLIFPEEFTAGRLADLFEIQPPENRGDGTTVTRQ
jgi:hypothetical protein